MPNTWSREDLTLHLKHAHDMRLILDTDTMRDLQHAHRSQHRGRSHPKVSKTRRMQLAKSELWLAAAVWAQSHADSCADKPGCGTIPFEQYPADDPERQLARTYGLTGLDLAKAWEQLAAELEARAMRAGYDDAWVGVEEAFG